MRLDHLPAAFIARNLVELQKSGFVLDPDASPATPPHTPFSTAPESARCERADRESPPSPLNPLPKKPKSPKKNRVKISDSQQPTVLPSSSESSQGDVHYSELERGGKDEPLGRTHETAVAKLPLVINTEGSSLLPSSSQKLGDMWRFTIPGQPMGKPRQSQRDKWAKRECVLRFRSWADVARASVPPGLPKSPVRVNWTAYFAFPRSYSLKKRLVLAGQLHRVKPDRDNVDKGLLDALWPDDSCIALGRTEKRWDDGYGQRLVVEVFEA